MELLDDRSFIIKNCFFFVIPAYIICIISEIHSNYDWWYVRHPKNDVGYAPRNFLARIESLESEEWLFKKYLRS